jgi:pimeloyl-ACP methyl ester carboxylesterase
MVALNTAIQAPTLVRAVVADSTVHGPLDPDSIRREMQDRRRTGDDLQRFWQQAHGEDWRQMVEADSIMLLESADTGAPLYCGDLGRVRCPVLLLGSAPDPIVPDMGAELCALARSMPRSKLILYSSGGHPLMWTRKPEYRRDVVQFLEGIP